MPNHLLVTAASSGKRRLPLQIKVDWNSPRSESIMASTKSAARPVHDEPADIEKNVNFRRVSGDTLQTYQAPNLAEKDGKFKADDDLVLSDAEALAHARANPADSTPMIIRFSMTDSANPRNWSRWRKYYITIFVSMLNNLTCWCSSSLSLASLQIAAEFDVSMEITTLLLSTYIFGFALGPVVLAPLSEKFGRSPVYNISWGLLVIFHIPIALAPNIGTLLVCRFLAGFFGSAPLTNTGGTVSDLWSRNESGYAMCIYGLSSTLGPNLALVVTGYMIQEKGWRLETWIIMAIVGGFWILLVITIPETRHTTILDKKTSKLRKQMRKEKLAAAETVRDANADEKKGLRTLFFITLTRPVRFLVTEPITTCSALYNGFLYGLVYLFNESIPLVFMQHDFDTGQQGLSFLGLCVGTIAAAAAYPFIQERYYLKQVAANDGKGDPEARMFSARFGAFLIPISLFWFAWTSYASVHWIVPIIASTLFGAGLFIVILSILSYLIDSYQSYSASALAGTILVRNLFGTGFPLFASQMYKKLGYEWAGSLLGFLSILLVPIPFLLFYRGDHLRLRSPWARRHFEQNEDTPH